MEQLRSYELDGKANTVLASLAGAMRFVAVIHVVLGAIYGVVTVLGVMSGHVAATLGGALQAIYYLALGVILSGAAVYFRKIVDSHGQDIPYLMVALDRLRRYFNLQRMIILILLGLALVAIVLAVLLMQR
ncbi:MAG: hypothetical protein WKG01_23280 [Kofleriaceae bacterium]